MRFASTLVVLPNRVVQLLPWGGAHQVLGEQVGLISRTKTCHSGLSF